MVVDAEFDTRPTRSTSIEWQTSWLALAVVLTLSRQLVGITNLVPQLGRGLRAIAGLAAIGGGVAAVWWVLKVLPMRRRRAVRILGRLVGSLIVYMAVWLFWLILIEVLTRSGSGIIGGIVFAGLVSAGVTMGVAGLSRHKRLASAAGVALFASLGAAVCGVVAVAAARSADGKYLMLSVLGFWALSGLMTSLVLSKPAPKPNHARSSHS